MISEVATEPGLTEMYYDIEDYPEGYTDLIKGIPELDALQTIKLDDADIPYWKEVLTYSHYPNQNRW